jgi:adenylate cyclase
LCQKVGEAPQLFSVFLGLWGRRFVRAEFQAADELLEQWSSLAERISDPGALATTTGYMRGAIAYFRGEVVLARTQFEQVLAGYHPLEHGSVAVRYGMYSEPALACGCWRASSLLLLGYGDQALAQSGAALALARQLGHPPSLASAVAWTAVLHSTRRDVRAAREHAEAAIALATELGFPYRLAEGKIIRGWSLAAAGEMTAGLAELREGIDAWRATGAALSRPLWLALLAEAYERSGQPGPAVPAVIEALETANETGERLFEAELHRLHGALLLQEGGTSVVERAEACFRQALAVALRQQTRLFELRAATSLARLWYDQGKRAQARDLLTPIYGWFTEGFDTQDLKDAKALLDALR